jgi:steroid 5-alpha reductase family enzyme
MVFGAIIAVIVLNLAGLIYCYTQQSDKVTDLIYALSFEVLAFVLWYNSESNIINHIMLIITSLWSIRLGVYLFIRVHKMGHDNRFEQMRKNLVQVSGFWTLQTASILILSTPIIILFQKSSTDLSGIHLLGAMIWLAGWLIESIADLQKYQFRTAIKNKGNYINTGLWKIVQHPNYLGEILCWFGLFIFVSPVLEGWEWLSVISPLWISLLLIKISGIPLLQISGQKKYGEVRGYSEYRKKTALLIPYIY